MKTQRRETLRRDGNTVTLGDVYTRIQPRTFQVDAFEENGRWFPVVDGDLILSGMYRDMTKTDPYATIQVPSTGCFSRETALYLAMLECDRIDAEQRALRLDATARADADRYLDGGHRAYGKMAATGTKAVSAYLNLYDFDGSIRHKMANSF